MYWIQYPECLSYEHAYSEAIGFYGYDNQAVQAIEEMAELIKALNKFRRNSFQSDRKNIA